MLKHYIKFAFRNFKSNKVIFGGSLLTLCLGALSVTLLSIYLYNELTINDFHKREKDIYLFVNKTSPITEWEAFSPSPFFKFDRREHPEIETGTKIKKYREGELSFVNKLNTFYPEGIVVDSTFFDVFDFDLITNNKETVLNDPQALLISTGLASKMFGKSNPIGEQVTVGDFMSDSYVIKGVFEKPRTNSSISFDFILPDSYVPNQYAKMGAEFLLMQENFSHENFTSKIEKLGENHNQFTNSLTDIMPFSATYFNETGADFKSIFSKHGKKRTLYILGIILLVILLISAINMSNLQFINTNTSVKFIALSVINGAHKKNIIFQKIVELLILTILSSFLVTICYLLILPELNSFIDFPIFFPLWKIVLLNITIIVTISLLAITYPVLIALNIPLVKSLKNQSFFSNTLSGRKNVIVAQFVLTFVLLISTIVVVKQLNMMLDKEIGFKSENIIKTQLYKDIPIPVELFSQDLKGSKEDREQKMKENEDKRKKYQRTFDLVRGEIENNSNVINFAQGKSPLEVYKTPWKVKNSEEKFQNHNTITVSPNYLKVFGLEIVEGRFFDINIDKPYSNKIVINEAAKKYWNISDIKNTKVNNKFWDESSKGGYEIIGVVKNFNSEHLSSKIKPLVMVYFENPENDFLIELEKESLAKGLQFINDSFKKINPKGTFKYSFVSDEIANLYSKEKQLSLIYITFTILALLISAIGLFTIAMYDTQRRVKEIGIRKVNGAKTHQILVMLNRDFTKNILIAFFIACPISYVLMSKWLENFAYKTTLSWWIFISAGIFTLIIALLTVSRQSYKASISNPVKSLRTE